MVVLYHGTDARNRSSIQRSGIRRFSWFSTVEDDAKDFGELQIGPDRHGTVDIWEVRVAETELQRIAWQLGSKRGTFYKLHHKPKDKPRLIDTYDWDLRTMPQRPGKVR